jgi:hypothetical protein
MVNYRVRVPANPLPHGHRFFADRYRGVCRHPGRQPVALSITTVSLHSYGSDSNSVLQDIPTSHAVPIMGEYVPGYLARRPPWPKG